MRDLIEHYKTLISANLFEGKSRVNRLRLKNMRDFFNPEIKRDLEAAEAKLARREYRLLKKTREKKVNSVLDNNPHLRFHSVDIRSYGLTDPQMRTSSKLLDNSTWKKNYDASRARHRPENP